LSGPTDEADILMISDPVATLVSSDRKIWLCIGEISSLKIDGNAVSYLSLDMLTEETVTVSYQVLGLRPANSDDDPDMIHDWRTYWMDEHSFSIPGRLIQPLNPSMSKAHKLGQNPWYLFQSTVLVALAASFMEQLSNSHLKNVPRLAASNACFIVSDNLNLADLGSADCPRCSPAVALDLSQGQRVLEHIGAHILHEPTVLHSSMPLCGLCLHPAPLCQMFLKKGKGSHASLTIDPDMSKGCLMKVKFSYRVASESTNASPCSNVPIQCPRCSTTDPAIWKYFLRVHFLEKHKDAPLKKYEDLWKLSDFEKAEMKRIWARRSHVVVKRTKKAGNVSVVVSEDHRAQIPRRHVNGFVQASKKGVLIELGLVMTFLKSSMAKQIP
ncbi:hypothetical protein BJ912DRAFT_859221, partial [Pholiota molesta]